jgi:basic membrane protein A
MSHKMRFVWLFASLTAALALIGLAAAVLHTESVAIARTGTRQDGTALSTEQKGGLMAPTAITVGLVADGPTVEDGSFNELSYQGILRAESELGITYQVYTSASEADYLPNLQQCASNGANLCFGVGFLMADAISQTALLYPETSFALVDHEWESQPPNLRGITFASDQVGYLAGTLAALMSDSHVVGTVAGMAIPTVQPFVNGYLNGAQCADPSTTVIITYTGTFVDPELGAQTAQEQMLLGADVIFGVGGATGNGAILTATQSGAWGIGVDLDQYNTLFGGGAVSGSDRLLSSAMKRLDNAVFDTISDVNSGTFTGGTALYTVAEDGVGLAPFHETDPLIPLSVRSRISGVEQGLREGWLDVYGPCVATIGVAAGLSGSVPDLGWQQVNAVQLAISQTNAAGGLTLNGVNYTLHIAIADSGCDPATLAVTAANTLLNAGALAVVGHTCSASSFAAQPVYAAAGVPMISPSSTNPNVTQLGYTTTFRTVSHDASPVQYMATYFRQWMGYTRSAIVSEPGAEWLRDLYSDTFVALGGTITGDWVVANTADFTATLEVIKSQDPDVIFVAGYAAAEPGQISRIAYDLGMSDVPIAWDSMSEMPMWMYAYLGWAGAEAAQGDFIAMHQLPFWAMPGWGTLVSEYQAAGFANAPDDPGTFGAFAYDTAGLLVDTMTRADNPDTEAIRNAIATTPGYDGVVGAYEGFGTTGDVIPQWMWIARYQDGDWRLQISTPDLGNEWHVCASGCDFTTIQDAVNAAADGDIIKVAAGTYSDLHSHTAPVDYYGPTVITQVVYIDKDITLRGGYPTSDWDMPAPAANPTIIDAGNSGRGIVIAGDGVAPIVEGFHITNGDATGLGGSARAGGADGGGGVFIIGATPTLNNCQIYGNTAHQGGGVYVDRTAATLNENDIYANTANWGGAATLWDSDSTLTGNTITGNTVAQAGAPGPPDVFISAGGGLEIGNDGGVDSYPTLIGNTISGNSAEKLGGGLSLSAHVHATVRQNTISANTAITGGGLYLTESDAQIIENVISDNTAINCGGAMSLWDSNAWIQSNDIFSNTAQTGGGVHSYGSGAGFEGYIDPALFGNHIHANRASGGGGVFLEFSAAAIVGNTFEDNEATGSGSGVGGGGIFLLLSDATVDRNTFKFNIAGQGGALGFQGGNAKVYNNLIYDNQASQHGSAIYTFGASPYLAHNTIAYNSGGDGSAIYSTYWEPFDQTWDLVNTIIYEQAIGINASGAITINLDHVLWYNTPVTVTTDGTAAILAQNQLTDNPLFVYPDTRDFHLTAGSPALDTGMAMPDVTQDIDWQTRPMGLGYDIGADEYPGAHLSVSAATSATILLPGQTFTYSVALANDGALAATNALLTFALDPQQRAVSVTPGGVCTINGDWGGNVNCPLGAMPPGTEMAFVITTQVAATVPLGQIMESTATATADATASSVSSVKTVSRARLVYPLSYEPGSLDVNREAGDLNTLTVLAQLMEALYRYGTDGSLIPAGATGYTFSPDGLVYTVTLRTDALWSDGMPVTAQHYADSVIRMLTPETGAGYAYVLYPIQGAWEFNSGATTDPATVGVAVVDTHTLRFTLHSPAAFFPSILATSAMYPVRLDAVNTLPFVGNGPYNLTEWASGRFFVLDKNPRYHSAAQVVTSRVVLPVIPDAEQVATYEAGLTDVSTATGDALDYIMNDPILSNELRNVPWPGLYYLGLNTILTPTNDLNVRMALASAIDRVGLMNALNTPWREAATSVIPPGIPGYQNGAVGYTFNPIQAQTYLAQAGYPGGVGFPGVELWAYPGTEAMIEAIADDWRTTLNISVTLVYIDRGIYYNELGACRGTPGECSYNVYRGGWWFDYADVNNTLNDLFHPDSGGQYTYWDSAYYRQLMDLQIAETNPATRIDYLQEADRVLVEDDAVIVPIYFLDRPLLIKPNVSYEYPSIGGPRLMTWRTSGTAAPCYVRVSSLPGITYNDVQTAIDAAQPGDTLKLAGTCSTVHSRPRHDLTTTGMVTQVAYIDKSLIVQGGYTTTNWLHPDPVANPTTLDALGQGRVIYITGDVNVTVDGFHITGGDATGQGGSPWVGEDAGGGVYIITATVTLRKNQVFGNIANGGGGGAYLHYSPSTLESNTFAQNQGKYGGGVYLYASAATLKTNTVTANTVTNSGGGLYLFESNARVENNRIHNNAAVDIGGGVHVYGGNPIANGNLVYGNSAGYGGGLGLARTGGWWANNVIVDNHVDIEGSGIYALGVTAQLVHSTIARNSGGSGVGLYVTEHASSGVFSAVTLTNTILVDHSIGISVTGGNALTANTLLWYNTPLTVSSSPTAVVTILNDWIADPSFTADGYHLRIGSPAIDAGVPAAVIRDVDGDPRPYGNGLDIGADETPFVQVLPETGATLVYSDTEGTATTLVVPPDSVTETTTIVLTQLEPETLTAPLEFVAGGVALELDAYLGEEQVTGFTFDAPVTLTLEYTDADVAGMDESALQLYRYVCTDSESFLLCVWEVIGTRDGEGQSLDTEANVLTAWLMGFSRFGTLSVRSEPVFEIDKTYTGSRVAGTPVTYTLSVVNTGDADATAVELEDNVPEHLTWSGGGTLELNRVRWYIEAITASGGTGVGQFTAVLPCTASLAIVNDDYRVVSSAQGVTSTAGPPVNFTVIPPTITVGITYTPLSPVAGDTVYFTATATTNGTALSYTWSFGGAGQSATHIYPEAGMYTVTVTATDMCDYLQVASPISVTVLPTGHKVYLPLVMRQ